MFASKEKYAVISNSYLYFFLNIILYLLVFLLPLLYIGSLRDPSSLPRYAMYGVVSGILLSFLLIAKLINNKQIKLSLTLFFPVLLFACWAWLSLIWSVDPKNSLIELIQLTSCIIICYAITQLSSPLTIKWIIISSVTGGAIAASIGIAQYFNYNPLNYLQFSIPSSTFTNPNFAASYFDLITPLAFSLILLSKTNTTKLLAVLSSIVCLSFLLISHSRGSWLGMLFAFIGLIILICKNQNFKDIFIPLLTQNKFYLLISVVIPILIFSTPSTVETKKKFTDSALVNISSSQLNNARMEFDYSSKIRLDAYINSLAMIKDQPILGTGYGGFKNGFKNYMFHTVPFNQATEDMFLARLHSDPIQIFVELGLIGGLLFIYLYIIILQSCWKIINSTRNKHDLIITSGIFLAILAGGIHACVDFPFHKPASALQFWIWFAIVIIISTKTIPTKSLSINKNTASILVILGLIFSVYNFSYYQDYIAASKQRLLAETALIKENCSIAQKSADSMLSLFDADYRHQSLYVHIYSQCEINTNDKLSAMSRVLNYDKTNTRALVTRGTIYLQQNETQSAINDFLQVTRILPNRASGHIGLAYASLQRQDIFTAIKLLKHAVKVEPNNIIATNLLKKITVSKQ